MKIFRSQTIISKIEMLCTDLKLYMNTYSANNDLDSDICFSQSEVNLLLSLRTKLKKIVHQLNTRTVTDYEFKFICEVNEYGMTPLWDTDERFYTDDALYSHILKNYNEDNNYQVWGFDGTDFKLLKNNINF